MGWPNIDKGVLLFLFEHADVQHYFPYAKFYINSQMISAKFNRVHACKSTQLNIQRVV